MTVDRFGKTEAVFFYCRECYTLNNHMPQIPLKQRPSVMAWIAYLAALAVCVTLIVTAFTDVFSSPKPQPLTGMSSGGFIGSMPPSFPEERLAIADMGVVAASKSAVPSPSGNIETLQRIIKTGDLSLRVADAAKGLEEIDRIASAKGGFVESSSISDPGAGPRSAWATVRVPAKSFDDAMRDLKSTATVVLSATVQGQDVTSEFIDLEADIRNARAAESSYLDLLKRTGSVEDILAVTQQLNQTRGEIERLEARKRYMENRTDLATISVSLTEDTRVEFPEKTWKPLEVFRQAMRELVVALQGLVNFVIRLVIALIGLLVPIALLVALLLWLGWRVVRRFLRRIR
jgi:BMFP domain-containing protein YqiC